MAANPFLNSHQVPHHKAEPVQVVFRLAAGLGDIAPGYYDWTLSRGFPAPAGTVPPPPAPQILPQPFAAQPRVDLDPQNLYAVQGFSFSADIESVDYAAAIDVLSVPPGGTAGVPVFTLQVDSEKGAPITKQPIPLPQFYENVAFPKWRQYLSENDEVQGSVSGGVQTMDIAFMGIKSTNQFEGSFQARLQQTPSLIGKASITLILTLNMLEIRDPAFISQYMARHGDLYK